MKWFLGTVSAAVLLSGLAATARAADEQDTKAILDKAIKALGGEARLSKTKASQVKLKGTITFMGGDNEVSIQSTTQGLNHHRAAFAGDFGGNKVEGVTVIAGDKGWRSFNGNTMELDAEHLANEKRNLYLDAIPAAILPLRAKGFKVAPAGTEKVGGKPAVGIKVTGPDGKDFKLYFDAESGLPVKMVAKVLDFMDTEFTQETTYSNYKDFDGIKVATKIARKRDGDKFMDMEVKSFKVLKEVPKDTFAEPK
jgi:hypothetical protein